MPRPPAKPPRTQKTARFAAIETLCRLERSRSPVKPLSEDLAIECRLTGDDRGLAMNIVYGVLRQRQYLRLLIGLLCRHPLHKLSPFILHALEVGLYQLFFLDRIPESAAVNETVNALKAARIPARLHGLVNGILREGIRRKISLPAPGTDQAGRLCLNHPSWLIDRWQRHFGEEATQRICTCNNREPQLVLRVNTGRISREILRDLFEGQGIACRDGSFAPDALILPGHQGAIALLPGYEEGFFQIQDEVTQLATLLLKPLTHGGSYLDACAGLGGKTCHLMGMAAESALHITALEPQAHRYRKLGENLQRLFPAQPCTTYMTSLQDFARDSATLFHGVLIDAPCSGTGVTGRHPDIRWNRREEELTGYQDGQIDLLHQAAGLVLQDGILVYATCSLEPEENSNVIAKFLEMHQEFNLTDPSPCLPPAARILVEDRLFHSLPDGTLDGFFAARLQRR